MLARRLPRPEALLFILGGPAAAGAAVGVRFGVRGLLIGALYWCAVNVGVMVLMLPALHIAFSLVGQATPPKTTVDAGNRALRASGLVLLGLAPAMLFLLSTAGSDGWVAPLAVSAATAGAAAGLRSIFEHLFGDSAIKKRSLVAFALWALVALMIGGRLLSRSFIS